MIGKRSLLCALLVGLGGSLAGCVQPIVYSGGYLGRDGPVYGGLYFSDGGAYTGSQNTGLFTGPYYGSYAGAHNIGFFSGPYYGGYYWRNGFPYHHGVYHRRHYHG
jgi:hypothetical protein